MPERISCIYSIVSPSGKAYIGSTCNYIERRKRHRWGMASGRHHCDAINYAVSKYGVDAFAFEILERCEVDRLIEREQWWFVNHARFAGLYNSSGIAGRPEHTPEVREKLAKAARGKVPSAETRAKISAASKRQVRTPEWNKAVADAQRGKVIPDEAKAKMSAAAKLRKRLPMSELTKQSISKAKKGKPVSDAHRAALSAAQLKRFKRDGPPMKSEATKAKMREAALAREARKRAARASPPHSPPIPENSC